MSSTGDDTVGDLVLNRDLRQQLMRAAVTRLEWGSDAESDLPAGVRILDSWHSGGHAAVLFRADRELDFWGFCHAVIYQVGRAGFSTWPE